MKEKGREEEEKQKRKKRRKVWIYDFEFGYLFGFAMVFVWILVDLLKVGLVIPYFVQDELVILPWVWILGLRCMDTSLGVRKLT